MKKVILKHKSIMIFIDPYTIDYIFRYITNLGNGVDFMDGRNTGAISIYPDYYLSIQT